MNKKNIAAVVFLSFVVVVSGCINGEEERNLPEGDVAVNVGEMYFQQAESDLPEDVIEAGVGDTIVFYNEGSTQHTVTVPHFEIDEDIDVGETVVFEVEDSVEGALVDCTLHGTHEAELTVTE